MRRLGWGVADQALSSACTALFLLAIARVASVEEFGRFSLCALAVVVLTATCRGVVGMRIALLGGRAADVVHESTYAVAATLVVGSIAALGLLAAGRVADLGPWVAVLAVGLPVALSQDVLRYTAASLGRTATACVADGLWVLALFVVAVLVWTGVVTSLMTVVVGWLGGAVLALGVLVLGLGVRPRVVGFMAWAGAGGSRRFAYGAEAFVGVLATFVVLGVAAGSLGSAGVAALRGAATVFGVVMVLLQSIPLALVPELRSRNIASSRELWRATSRLALPFSLAAVALGTVSLAVPDTLGELALGPTWDVTRPILAITGIEYGCLVWMNMASAALRAQDRAAEVLTNRLVFAGSAVVLGGGAGLVAGTPEMVAVGLAAAAAVGAGWTILRLLARDDRVTQPVRPNSIALARRMSGSGRVR